MVKKGENYTSSLFFFITQRVRQVSRFYYTPYSILMCKIVYKNLMFIPYIGFSDLEIFRLLDHLFYVINNKAKCCDPGRIEVVATDFVIVA
jgi:hypothetical protein